MSTTSRPPRRRRVIDFFPSLILARWAVGSAHAFETLKRAARRNQLLHVEMSPNLFFFFVRGRPIGPLFDRTATQLRTERVASSPYLSSDVGLSKYVRRDGRVRWMCAGILDGSQHGGWVSFFFYLPFFLFLCIDHVPAHATHDVDDFAIDFFHLLSPLHFLFGCLSQLVLAWCRKAMDLGEALVGCWVGWLDGVPSLAMWPAFTSSLGHVS